MRLHQHRIWIIAGYLCLLLTAAWCPAQKQNLPQGRNGIASKYPGDRGLRNADSVVFVEHFDEPRLKELLQGWESARGDETDQLLLSNQPAPNSVGEQSLLMKHIGGKKKTIDLYRRLKNESGEYGFDQLFCRMYVKFGTDCAPIHHMGTNLGGNNPPKPWPQVSAGERPAGDEQFWVGVEPFGENWTWDYYTYWMEMRGSPPNGKTWGNRFINNSNLRAQKGRWICIELMVKMNDVGKRNGELALWINGRNVSHLGKGFPRGTWIWDKFHPGKKGTGVKWDNGRTRIPGNQPFEGFRWRTTEALNINYVWPYIYITEARDGKVSRVWFDQIVVAKRYIGPISKP